MTDGGWFQFFNLFSGNSMQMNSTEASGGDVNTDNKRLDACRLAPDQLLSLMASC